MNADPTAQELVATTTDPTATLAVAAALGRVAAPGLVVALCGEMGAGKTTFVRGLAAGLDSPDDVASPTYTLMHAYRGRLELLHFDAWLTGREAGFLSGGGGEAFDSGAVCAVEWASEVEDFLPEDRLEVELLATGLEERRLLARARGPRALSALAAWRDEIARSAEPPGGRDVGGDA
jgi:tRNA threonylcarbamoyladenosine biosynthesis protein TsaE